MEDMSLFLLLEWYLRKRNARDEITSLGFGLRERERERERGTRIEGEDL